MRGMLAVLLGLILAVVLFAVGQPWTSAAAVVLAAVFIGWLIASERRGNRGNP